MSAQRFADEVVWQLTKADERASFIVARARGKTAVLGYEYDGEWVPLFRITGGSAAYNVASLQVRHRSGWQPTFVRGVPATMAERLSGPFRFLWEIHAPDGHG
jgi:hypothetical protein